MSGDQNVSAMRLFRLISPPATSSPGGGCSERMVSVAVVVARDQCSLAEARLGLDGGMQ